MSEYYSSNTVNELNSQFLNNKKCLNCGPYFSCSSKCECICFFPKEQSVIARAGACARTFCLFVRLGTSEIQDFFFIHRSRNTMGHSLEFLSLYFACEHSEIFPSIIYCALLVFLDSWMHQKTQNSRDETTAMETHFYTTEIFFSFMRIFLYTFRNIPYNFFNLFSYFQNNECKKSRNSRGKTRAMESHFYSMDFFFFHENFPKYIHKHSLKFLFYAVFVFPE